MHNFENNFLFYLFIGTFVQSAWGGGDLVSRLLGMTLQLCIHLFLTGRQDDHMSSRSGHLSRAAKYILTFSTISTCFILVNLPLY
jgi:hypothetical protein